MSFNPPPPHHQTGFPSPAGIPQQQQHQQFNQQHPTQQQGAFSPQQQHIPLQQQQQGYAPQQQHQHIPLQQQQQGYAPQQQQQHMPQQQQQIYPQQPQHAPQQQQQATGFSPQTSQQQHDPNAQNLTPQSQQPQQQQQQQQPILSPELKDGLRWNFNILPNSRADATKVVLPIGCLYSPLHRPENEEEGTDAEATGDKEGNSEDANSTPSSQTQKPPHHEIPVLKYNPVVCRQCRCILNPYCRVDFRSKTWTCPLCLSGNNFPVSYSGITEQNMPAELFQDFTTIEYVLSNPAQPAQKLPPVFLYVVDTCLRQDELDYLKEGLLTSLDLLPEDAVVGLITYGTTVQLYELGYSEWTNAYVFRGDKALNLQEVQQQLGLEKQLVQGTNQTGMISKNAADVRRRFLLPLQEVELTLTSIIEDLQPDPWPVRPNSRSRRATGVALSVATSLLESSFAHQGGRIMNFIGGPCTLGDGTVAGLEHKEQLRLHNDLSKGTAKYYKSATKFYQGLTQRLVRNGHCVDVWAANLDQCGVLEMKSCCENTGGTLVLTDTFNNPVFRNSLNKIFERDNDDQLKMAFNASLEVQTSADIRICGALGPVTSMNSKHRCVSDTEIGYGRTNSWKINALDPGTTIAIYFDVPAQTTTNNASPARFFQFVTTYQHANGERRLRVTTTGVRYAQSSNLFEIAQGFDQECAAVLVSRLAVFKAESEYLFDVLRWLDRSLIHLVSRFGSYQKGNPNSLELPPNFQFFPQFMYHLRRSQFLRVFNSSPDETAFYRLHLNRVNTHDGLTMIQPSLCTFTMQSPESLQAVPLDSDSVRKDVALLMDTYFLVLIQFGERIAYWRDEKYHEDPQYVNLKKLLEAPSKQAKKILKHRFPYPRYIVCDEGTSQARHLLARINPSTTHHNQYQGNTESTLVYSDDANFHTFQAHLSKIVSEEGSGKN